MTQTQIFQLANTIKQTLRKEYYKIADVDITNHNNNATLITENGEAVLDTADTVAENNESALDLAEAIAELEARVEALEAKEE